MLEFSSLHEGFLKKYRQISKKDLHSATNLVHSTVLTPLRGRKGVGANCVREAAEPLRSEEPCLIVAN